MALSNRDRIARGLEVTRQGLEPYVEAQMEAVYGPDWGLEARDALREYGGGQAGWDTQALLKLMQFRWNEVFRAQLGNAERSYVNELRDVRNSWAHEQPFSADDTYRALDTMHRLLQAIGAGPEGNEIERQKQEVLRLRYEEQVRRSQRKGAGASINTVTRGGLTPWREVITPHPDVASGNYVKAEFAADLDQVYRGIASDEYANPRDFFGRTYLTQGLQRLLVDALERLSGRGGDPVVELQTNFGGGKTHSMLALYHLFSGVPASELPNVEPVLRDARVPRLFRANRAVLVGLAMSPSQVYPKGDGVTVHTLWGELAWQLLGEEGYRLVADADIQGISPGTQALRELFERAAPCLILIDEWVAYMRGTYRKEELPGGSFDTNLTFAQALTEAAKASPRTLVVATLPQSQIEIGGEGGSEALRRLENTVGRVQSAWRPATAEEGFHIVKRRLFQPIADHELYAARDAVTRAFSDLYRSQSQEFPGGTGDSDYERRMQEAYPIHPELFDLLYNEWSTLERFQRTRGVLRLMSAVIHSLWEQQDRSLLIMPAQIPLDDPAVQSELNQYLEQNWAPIIESDVDGPNSLPLRVDRQNPNLGKYSAARRDSRTIFIGSVPTLQAAHKGMDERRIKLGAVQPGESVAVFGDALRRLTDQSRHLYVNEGRYWYSTQPNVTRLAQDLAERTGEDAVHMHIERLLQQEARQRGDFVRVHAFPGSPSDMPDERDARLVILRPASAHSARQGDSPAREEARELLEQRGAGPRIYRNTLVFLAPDRTRLDELKLAVRQYLAWSSIQTDKEAHNLDAFQSKQVDTKAQQAADTAKQRIPETYIWLLVPTQDGWEEYRLQGQEALAVRAGKKLRIEDQLVTQYAGTLLRMELDRVPLWQGDRIAVNQLAGYYAQYPYLPRLRDTEVLLGAIRDGVGSMLWREETFAYAEGYDEAGGRYVGLKAGEHDVRVGLQGLVVKPSVAAEQLDRTRPTTDDRADGGRHVEEVGRGPEGRGPAVAERALPRRFYGAVDLDTMRIGRDVGQILQEVIQHLEDQRGSKVRVSLTIEAEVPEGASADLQRTITENARTLRFKTAEFEGP